MAGAEHIQAPGIRSGSVLVVVVMVVVVVVVMVVVVLMVMLMVMVMVVVMAGCFGAALRQLADDSIG